MNFHFYLLIVLIKELQLKLGKFNVLNIFRGMLRSGFITGATLKACIKVVESDPYIEEEESEEGAEGITPGNPDDETTPGGPN